jgi:hypothetical protein
MNLFDSYSFESMKMFSYLSLGLPCLDPLHPNIGDYLYNVLMDLNKKLAHYIQSNGSTSMTKRFQLLHMASQNLVHRTVQQQQHRMTPVHQDASSTFK